MLSCQSVYGSYLGEWLALNVQHSVANVSKLAVPENQQMNVLRELPYKY